MRWNAPRLGTWLTIVAGCLCGSGCGTTRWSDTPRTATEQLLLSDAIDQAVNRLDFAALDGRKIFFETKYLDGVIDEPYVVSSLRQHLLASGCLLREKAEEAEIVVEARAGAIGTDRNEFALGTPSVPLVAPIAGVPALPAKMPEVTLAKKTKQRAVAKLAVFAYERATGQPVWQSGSAPMVSYAGDAWFLGAGPFQRGDIHKGVSLAGEPLPTVVPGRDSRPGKSSAQIDTRSEFYFTRQTTSGDGESPPVANDSAELAAEPGAFRRDSASLAPAPPASAPSAGESSRPAPPRPPLHRAQDRGVGRRWLSGWLE